MNTPMWFGLLIIFILFLLIVIATMNHDRASCQVCQQRLENEREPY